LFSCLFKSAAFIVHAASVSRTMLFTFSSCFQSGVTFLCWNDVELVSKLGVMLASHILSCSGKTLSLAALVSHQHFRNVEKKSFFVLLLLASVCLDKKSYFEGTKCWMLNVV
jgi:hypothetical protein